MSSRFSLVAPLIVLVAASSPVAAQQAIIIVRHAEKAADTGDPPLSAAGRKRAADLVERLKDSGITSIYVTNYIRTRQTADPIATALKITPVTRDSEEPAARLLAHLAQAHPDGTVLLVAHTHTIPGIIDSLLKRRSGIRMADDEYDRMYVLVRQQDGSWSLVRAKF